MKQGLTGNLEESRPDGIPPHMFPEYTGLPVSEQSSYMESDSVSSLLIPVLDTSLVFHKLNP